MNDMQALRRKSAGVIAAVMAVAIAPIFESIWWSGLLVVILICTMLLPVVMSGMADPILVALSELPLTRTTAVAFSLASVALLIVALGLDGAFWIVIGCLCILLEIPLLQGKLDWLIYRGRQETPS